MSEFENSKTFSTNAVEVYESFYSFTTKEMRRVLRTGVNKALQKIVRDARGNLRRSFKNTNKINPRFNDTLQKGIRKTKIHEDPDGTIWGKVRAHSTNKHGSGAYRLPMLENGTTDRYVKTRNGKALSKPAYRGRIEGRHFFKEAVDSNLQTYNDTLITEINKAVEKINKKKFSK